MVGMRGSSMCVIWGVDPDRLVCQGAVALKLRIPPHQPRKGRSRLLTILFLAAIAILVAREVPPARGSASARLEYRAELCEVSRKAMPGGGRRPDRVEVTGHREGSP